MKTFRFLMDLLKGYRLRYYTAIALGVIISFIPLINNYLVKIIVDDVISGGRQTILLPILAVLFSITVLRVATWYYIRYQLEYVGQKIMMNIRTEGYKKILSLDFDFFDKTRTGDLMTRMTADLDMIRHFFSYIIYMFAEQGVTFLGALIFMSTVGGTSFWVLMLVIFPLFAYMAIKLAFGVKKRFMRVREMRARLNTVAQENIEANRVVKAFVREDYENEKMDRASEDFRQAHFAVNRLQRRYMPYLSNMQTLFTIYNIVVCGILVIHGQMTLGDLVMFNGMIWMITGPLSQSGSLLNDTANCYASADKIQELLSTDPDIQQSPHAVKERIQGNFDFINVSFGYESDGAVKNIHFSVKKGEKIAFVGPTGSGKSTIINLMSRFYDVSHGVILVDGDDIKNIDLDMLRGSIAVAQQDVFLFSETIAANIAYGKTDATMEDIIEAAKAAKAHDFIAELPDGYDTIVGERGMGLSGGQKQRLTLARALLKQPSVLVLDDTTSALDAKTEKYIQESLNTYFSDKTVFIISQRIASVKDCDQIIVLDRGRIVEHGKHEELLQNHGYYYDVFNHQYGDFQSREVLGGC
ncbi:MAG: ABC transporter ATP-binding protein [Clostridia bacterium]|nr:ABC transporter ATP-binding protein [Clostridia bacterium]